eukprot:10478399-Alexandrium_andersonii.AAC.1
MGPVLRATPHGNRAEEAPRKSRTLHLRAGPTVGLHCGSSLGTIQCCMHLRAETGQGQRAPVSTRRGNTALL